MDGNVITANFRGGRTTMTAPLWQYDYGQVLRFTGVSLPETYEVHFSNAKRRGDAKTAIGDANGAVIPDEFLATGDNVYAWIFLHATQEDGETEYMATIPVNKRATPSDEAPTPQEHQAIAALNSAVVDVQEAVDAADSARASATSAASSATAAAASEAGVEADADRASTAATAAESAQTAAEAAQAGAETAQTGAESARDEAAQASVAQIAQINATGAAVLESIPADYTELSEDVSNLKSDLTSKLNGYTAYNFDKTNSRINASGNFIYQLNYYRTDYIPCLPGMTIQYHGRNAWYQGEPIVSVVAFYDANKTFISSITSFSDAETSTTTGHLETTVPDNAFFVAACTNTLVTEFYFHLFNIESNIDKVPALEANLSKLFFDVNDTTKNNLNWAIGSFSDGTGAEVASTTRVRSKFVKTGKNTTPRIKMPETYSFAYYLYDLSNNYIGHKKFSANDSVIEQDCYIRIIVRYTDNTPITEEFRLTVASQLQLFYVKPTYETIGDNVIYNIPENIRKKGLFWHSRGSKQHVAL